MKYTSLHLKGKHVTKSVCKNMLHYNPFMNKNAGPDILGISYTCLACKKLELGLVIFAQTNLRLYILSAILTSLASVDM